MTPSPHAACGATVQQASHFIETSCEQPPDQPCCVIRASQLLAVRPAAFPADVLQWERSVVVVVLARWLLATADTADAGHHWARSWVLLYSCSLIYLSWRLLNESVRQSLGSPTSSQGTRTHKRRVWTLLPERRFLSRRPGMLSMLHY